MLKNYSETLRGKENTHTYVYVTFRDKESFKRKNNRKEKEEKFEGTY